MEELIAFKDTDNDGDAWGEIAFLFKSEEDAKCFFTADNPKLIEIYTDEEGDILDNFEVNDNNPAGRISSVTFKTEYAGIVVIKEMSKGFFIL